MMTDSESLTEKQKDFSTMINKSAEQIEKITDSVLNLTKSKADLGTFTAEFKSENDLVKEEIRNLYDQLQTCETDINLYKQTLLQKEDDNANTLEQISECMQSLKELTLRKDETHNKVKEKFKAYKEAYYYYKVALNLYVHVELEDENTFLVKLCFFTTNKQDDTYSATLTTNDKNEWKLKSINPNIIDCQFIALKERLEKTNNIAAFTCTLRRIFLLLKNK